MGKPSFVANRGGAVDLLSGTPWKRILRFALPLFIGNLFQQLYNTVDSVIVGRWVGHVALAAVGVSAPMLFLLASVFMGVAMGSSILVAQYFGARSEASLRRTLHTSIVLALLLGTVLSVIGFVFAPAFLRLLNTPEDAYHLALSYMRILFIGATWMLLYNMVGGFMRGMGDSRTPLLILIVSSITNIILDLIFVVFFHMGVAGAAWATIISQFLSAIVAMAALHRLSPLTRISLKELRLSLAATKEIVKLGFPTAIQQAVMSIGGVIVQGFVNSYGTSMIAAHNVAMRVDMFAVMPVMSFSMAMVSYTGQNVGAGRMDRVYLGTKQGVALCTGITVFMSTMMYTFGKYALMLFTDDVGTLTAGVMIIRIVVPFYILMAVSQTLGGVMRGAGETVSPMINALMMNILVRIPLVLLLNYLFRRAEGIYWSQVGGLVLSAVHMLIVYKRGSWEKKALARIKAFAQEREDGASGRQGGFGSVPQQEV